MTEKIHWQEYHRAWQSLTPPLRPHANVVSVMKHELVGAGGPALLLGVTPELANISPDLTAVDRNPAMIANIWPGDTATRRAVLRRWQDLDFPNRSFAACIGDGSFNSVRYPDEWRECLGQIIRVLRSNARLICRFYLSPDRPEALADLKEAALSGAIGNFHAFKLRLGMCMAAQRPTPQIEVDSILRTFETIFVDRDRLSGATGWPRDQIDTIDFYRESAVEYCFPTRAHVLSVFEELFAHANFVPTAGYELAEQCPLLVAITR